ncbi:MAG: adenylate/guanylate cyclase domain-containing protein [Candidatus Velthaea sp.]
MPNVRTMEPAIAAPAAAVSERPLPQGLLTFLFTDIEGSTLRWDRDPDAMQTAVRRHDVLMRGAIEASNGVVFKTIGDAFCAVFERVEDGLHAVLAAQRSVIAEDFSAVDGVRVRMALHVGTSDERDSDYFGPTLNRVARLLAIGHGAQVLLSQVAAETVAGALPPGVMLRDMGEHRLKDLSASERVYQVVATDLPSEFPKLKSLSVLDNNLPHPTTTFVGRERDVADIKALLQHHRLVTLLGTGGVGKTRCGVQAAADLIDDFEDGVWFADFAPLRDATLVANEIASLFNVQESPNRPMTETLVDHLRNKHALLILDNCEHVVVEASKVSAALLRSCQHVRILTTSREGLNVAGEMIYRMPSLSVPESTKGLTAQRAMSYGAVALFESRARAINARFVLTDDNAPVAADICRRLDGIPLAIELAAARVKVLSVRELAKKLDERFRVLTGGDRTALPRQQTMRALIDWSYDGLAPEEQTVFRHLSVFAGGFDLQTATTVCRSTGFDEFELLDHLTSLVDKSLVVMEHSDEMARYRLLESMRAYGREKLIEHGEAECAAASHADAYTERAEQHELGYETMTHRRWLAAVDCDLENVRAALTWSFANGEVLTGQRLAATLGRILLTSAAAEARRWVKIALERVDSTTPTVIAARLEIGEAFLASVLNQYKAALAAAQRALALYAELGDKRGIADAQRLAGRSMVRIGRIDEGEALLKASLITHTSLGSRRVGGTLRDLAVARATAGDLASAREFFAQALSAFRRYDDEENQVLTASALAEAEFACGDAEAALPLAEEALDGVRAMGRDRMAAALLCNISAYLIVSGQYGYAEARAREALCLARDVEADVLVAYALQHLAAVAALQPRGADDLARAARLTGFVDERVATLEIVREPTEQREYEVTLGALREALPAQKIMSFMNDGRTWPVEHAISAALSDEPALTVP